MLIGIVVPKIKTRLVKRLKIRNFFQLGLNLLTANLIFSVLNLFESRFLFASIGSRNITILENLFKGIINLNLSDPLLY